MTASFIIGPEHPAVSDHYPGQPIVPAALILSHVLKAAYMNEVVAVGYAKFLSPLLPGETCDIELQKSSAGMLEFCCRSGQHVIAKGHLTLRESGS